MGADPGEMTKSAWRKRMAAVRDALPAADRERMSMRLCGHVEREVLAPLRRRLGRPLTIGVYGAFRSEADPLALVRSCWRQGDTVAAARIAGSELAWRIVREPGDWQVSARGIPEPQPARTAALPTAQAPDAVLVPGLAFHPAGGRLGYGGGYYDRMYAKEWAQGRRNICWIGFAFSVQVVASALPAEAHDLALDVLATDEGVCWLTKGRTR